MHFRPPALDSRSSLLRTIIAEDYPLVTDYIGDGDDPTHGGAKAEAEAYVAAVSDAIGRGEAGSLADDLADYMPALFDPEDLERGREDPVLGARQVGLAALQRAVHDALGELSRRSLEAPSRRDPVFVRCPSLFERVTKDGLVVLRPDDVVDEALLGEGAFAWEGSAIYPHPLLAPARELVEALLGLARRPELTVAVAISPFRVTDVDAVPLRLIEDYWYGVKVDANNLDSLDLHDTGVRTFHGARQGTPQRFFFPLLGTWFDWDRRSRHDRNDPVKRLYIREACPAVDRHGDLLDAVPNRELHSERDTIAHCFTHVDGKICLYDTARYQPTPERPDAPLGSAASSRKLWRVDGPMSDDTWGELVGLHFRQNELVQEHLDAAVATAGPEVEA